MTTMIERVARAICCPDGCGVLSGDLVNSFCQHLCFEAEARAAIEAAFQWLPIEEAPKDGTRVILGRDGCESDVGYCAPVAAGDHHSGWFSQGASCSAWGVFPPTHFMHLPAMPGKAS